MIKKNTKLIFEGEDKEQDLKGGMPLSKGETITLDNQEYEVIDKKTEIISEGEGYSVTTNYTIKKK